MAQEKLTDNELRIWLENYGLSDRAGQVLQHVANIVHAFSVNNNETRPQTIRRLEDAKNILRELISATATGHRWLHRTDLYDELYCTGYENSLSFVDRRSLSNVAAALIERPWLESHFIEWVIVDALVCDEIREFGRSILDNPLQVRDVPFVGNKLLEKPGIENVILGIARAALIRWTIRLVLFLGLPTVGILYGICHNHVWMILLNVLVFGLYLSTQRTSLQACDSTNA
jgi:hypothetical protein